MIIVERIHHKEKWPYIEKYGHHFNQHSLDFAVSQMRYLNNEGVEAPIVPATEEMLKRFMDVHKVTIKNYHLYDCLYVLNMARADFLRSSIEDEKHLILYVKDLIDDPDGYEGLVFNRWCADMKGKGVEIPWNDFV